MPDVKIGRLLKSKENVGEIELTLAFDVLPPEQQLDLLWDWQEELNRLYERVNSMHMRQTNEELH